MLTVSLAHEQDTLGLGARLSGLLGAGDVVALTGGLGAGKTTLSRGLIKAMTDADEVPSPTYTLVQTYEAPTCELWHCDMYRLEQPEDAYELGLIEAFHEAVCLVEWPDKLGGLLPETALHIDIQFDGDGRKAVLSGWGTRLDG